MYLTTLLSEFLQQTVSARKHYIKNKRKEQIFSNKPRSGNKKTKKLLRVPLLTFFLFYGEPTFGFFQSSYDYDILMVASTYIHDKFLFVLLVAVVSFFDIVSATLVF